MVSIPRSGCSCFQSSYDVPTRQSQGHVSIPRSGSPDVTRNRAAQARFQSSPGWFQSLDRVFMLLARRSFNPSFGYHSAPAARFNPSIGFFSIPRAGSLRVGTSAQRPYPPCSFVCFNPSSGLCVCRHCSNRRRARRFQSHVRVVSIPRAGFHVLEPLLVLRFANKEI